MLQYAEEGIGLILEIVLKTMFSITPKGAENIETSPLVCPGDMTIMIILISILGPKEGLVGPEEEEATTKVDIKTTNIDLKIK